MVTPDILNRHRGPYRLIGVRPFVTKPGFYRTETIATNVDRDEVQSLALAFLTDPRDTLTSVHVCSEREECFIGWFNRHDALTKDGTV